MKYLSVICIVFIICTLPACKKPAPQLPSNKNNVIDSTKYYLAQINSDIIAHEDSFLSVFVEQKYSDFKKTENGFWYKIISEKKGEKITKNDTLIVRYKLFNLNNQQLKTEKFVAVFGKKEMTTGLEHGLLLMHKGDSAEFIIPWYLAFGAKGNDIVKPYTSVIYKVYSK